MPKIDDPLLRLIEWHTPASPLESVLEVAELLGVMDDEARYLADESVMAGRHQCGQVPPVRS